MDTNTVKIKVVEVSCTLVFIFGMASYRVIDVIDETW
jgi:hypothetical protein